MRLDDYSGTLPSHPKTYLRTGCMAAFHSFREFEQYADEILDLLEDFANPALISSKVCITIIIEYEIERLLLISNFHRISKHFKMVFQKAETVQV